MKMPFLNDEILQDQHSSISYFMLTFINDIFDRVDGFHKVLGHDTLILYVILLTLPEVPPNDARTPLPHTLVAWLALTHKTEMHQEPEFEITSYINWDTGSTLWPRNCSVLIFNFIKILCSIVKFKIYNL